MNRKTFCLALCVLLLGLCVPLQAQQPGKIAWIAYLTTASSPAELPRLDSFRQGLRALGHIEGQNIVIEVRHTDRKFDRLAEIAAEIVRSKVDVLVVLNSGKAIPPNVLARADRVIR